MVNSNTLAKTLEESRLSREMVYAACERLAEELERGDLWEELVSFLTPENREIGLEYLKRFRRGELQRRVERELGLLEKEERIQVYPKGVLLHISAGNVDALPAYSVLEGLLTGNINLLKLPGQDKGLSRFLLEKLMMYEPLLKKYIYIYDTPSWDLEEMQALMEMADAVVLWGSDEAVRQVRKSAPVNMEIIEWGHKLSFCYLGEPSVPEEELEILARHFLTTNQLLCNSCQGVYLDTEDEKEIREFAKRLAEVMRRLEPEYPLPDFIQGKLILEALTEKLERIGREEGNTKKQIFRNGRSSVSCHRDAGLCLSGLFGNIWVKPLKRENIVRTLWKSHRYLQTAVVYPCTEELCRILARAGLTKITSIEALAEHGAEKTHDGAYALQKYVRLVEIKDSLKCKKSPG